MRFIPEQGLKRADLRTRVGMGVQLQLRKWQESVPVRIPLSMPVEEQLNPSRCGSRNVASGFFATFRIWVRRGRRSRPSPWSFLVEKNSVMKPTERTTCPYKNSLHVALAPVVGSLQSGAGLQAWSEEAVILAPQNMKPRGRFRSRPITCAGAVA